MRRNRRCASGAAVCVALAFCWRQPDSSRQTSPDTRLSLEVRVSVASKIYALLDSHVLDGKRGLSPVPEASYQTYLHDVLTTEDRRDFDLASIEFLAQLHNGHTLFLDSWLNKQYGQPLCFHVGPIEGKWVVQRSLTPDLKPGDVIAAFDGVPIEDIFAQQKRYIPASSERAQRQNLLHFPYLFPEKLKVKLEDGRNVWVNRAATDIPPPRTEGRWLKQSDMAVIRIPVFYFPAEDVALDLVRQYQQARVLILDLRNNPGGIPPYRLIRALMDRPYRNWKISVPFRIPLIDSMPQAEKPAESSPMTAYARGYHDALANLAGNAQLTWGGDPIAPGPGAYQGRLILLVDAGCVSACEDFVMPFKDNRRATLVGETTQGSAGLPYTYDFHNGMVVRIADKRVLFPDGSEFEGIGIKPDVEVPLTIDDLRQGRDVVLQKALELVEKP